MYTGNIEYTCTCSLKPTLFANEVVLEITLFVACQPLLCQLIFVQFRARLRVFGVRRSFHPDESSEIHLLEPPLEEGESGVVGRVEQLRVLSLALDA